MDVLVDRARRFTPAYDLQYRFKTPSTFNYSSRIFRPCTSDGKASSFNSNGQLQLDAIAAAQDSSVEAFRQSLKESLMIIQSGQSEIDPAALTNLNKIHILNLKQERASRQSTRNSASQRSLNRRPWTCDEGLHAVRRNLSNARTPIENSDSRASRRPRVDGLKQSFVEFLSKIDNQSTNRPKTYHHHPEYLSNRAGPEDRCQRCTGYPEIRIDGRKIGGLSGEGSMARQHCDVLGMTMCPDCIRTRARNDHFRKCNASVSEEMLDVYKLAIARQRIPSMISINDVIPNRSFARSGKAKVISVASVDSSGNHVTKISIEATETPDVEIKDPDTSAPKPTCQTIKVPEPDETNTSSDESVSLDVSRQEENPTVNEALKSADLGSETVAHNLSSDDVAKRKSKSRRKSPKTKSKLFNRGVVPSSNYFCNMSDLQYRIRKSRISKRMHFLEIEALADEIQTRQKEDQAKIESERDDSQSQPASDSSSPKTRKSPKIFEPPILFGQRPSALGVAIE